MNFNEERFNNALSILPKAIKDCIENMGQEDKSKIQEIRLRLNRKPTLTVNGGTYILAQAEVCSRNTINEVFEKTCGYSVHSHQNEINEGYITILGGHRVGFCGTKTQNTVTDISSINIRIASEIIGCGNEIASLYKKRNKGILLAGPPLSGKTTVLRDITRIIGNCQKTSLIDERNEIASAYHGVPQNDIGEYTDILTGYEKESGIETATRVLSPDVIICDEIASEDEAKKVASSVGKGVKFIATVHAQDIGDIISKPYITELFYTNAFGYLIMLGTNERVGKIDKIISAEDIRSENCSNNACDNLRISSW